MMRTPKPIYYIKMGRVYFNCGARNKQRERNALKVFEIALSKARHFELFCTLPLVLDCHQRHVTGRLQSKKILQQKTPAGEEMKRASQSLNMKCFVHS